MVENNTVTGIPGRDPGEIGSGIHVWNSQRFRLIGNQIVGTRDGFYIQSSSHGFVRGNRASDLRYGLHYMFSDDNVFEDNVFENGAAGAALMYSNRLTFRRNRFVRNRGFASVGPAAQGLRRRGRRRQPDRRQRARHLSRGLVSQPVPPQHRRACRTWRW